MKKGRFRCGHDPALRVRHKGGSSRCPICWKAYQQNYCRAVRLARCSDGPVRSDRCNRCGAKVDGMRAMAAHKRQHEGAVSLYQPLWTSTLGAM